MYKYAMNRDQTMPKWMRVSRLVLVMTPLMLFSMSCCATEKITILVLGDSLSSGYGLEVGEGWVELMARELQQHGRNVDIVNNSINGDTTAGGVVRLPAVLRRVKPNWVIIELGANDGLRGNSLLGMEQNLLKIVDLTRAKDAKPILLGMKLPPNYGSKYITEFERVYARVAAATNVPLLPFFIGGIEHEQDFFLVDGLHPNAAAQPIIKHNVQEFLEPLW